jgi:hypothetical protein
MSKNVTVVNCHNRRFVGWTIRLGQNKDYKGVYRLASKIKDEGFEADLYKKH